MAVTVNARIDTMPWRGFDDPSLPAAGWIGQQNGVGDGSGGNIGIRFFFQLSAEPLSARIYNVEQIHIAQLSNAVVQAQIEVVNMGHRTQDRPLDDYRYALVLNPGASAGGSDPAILKHPLFLGAPNAAGQDCRISVEVPNAVGQELEVTLWGYWWEPRSILAPGGVQRPATSPWGR